jgi:YtcA family
MRNRRFQYARVLPTLALAGCSRAPAFDIVGSLFPAWLLCIVLGIILAGVGRWLLLRWRITVQVPVLVYPCLAAFFTFALWLIFFS